jgi:hypothetical protein
MESSYLCRSSCPAFKPAHHSTPRRHFKLHLEIAIASLMAAPHDMLRVRAHEVFQGRYAVEGCAEAARVGQFPKVCVAKFGSAFRLSAKFTRLFRTYPCLPLPPLHCRCRLRQLVATSALYLYSDFGVQFLPGPMHGTSHHTSSI